MKTHAHGSDDLPQSTARTCTPPTDPPPPVEVVSARDREAPPCCCAAPAVRHPPRPKRAPTCCSPLDEPRDREGDLASPDDSRAGLLCSDCAGAETKYAMYLPALEAGLLRDSAGRLRDPLPGPAGVTEVMREARVQSGSKVLEVAATLGYVAMVAARIVGSTGEARVAQLDPALLAAARAHVAAHGLSHAVQIACVGTEVVPYPTGTFDAVISDRALCCLYTRPESQQRLLDEMARVMRPGGRLVVVEAVPVGAAKPGESSLPECIQGSMFVREPDRFVAMLRRSGFERIGITRIPNTRMATESMCETVGIPFSDEHMEFALISATKAGQARREARRGDPDGAARGSLGSDGRCTC